MLILDRDILYLIFKELNNHSNFMEIPWKYLKEYNRLGKKSLLSTV